MKNIIALVEAISGLTLISLLVVVNIKGKKLAKKLRPFLKEKEKRNLDFVWWKTGPFRRDYFLANAYKRFKEEIPSLIQFRNLFWLRNFFVLFALVIALIDLSKGNYILDLRRLKDEYSYVFSKVF
ncbi:MAG: hypothetical protein FWF41_09455 [Betaproteobacteria bacterium]|nr:hypothetical protein [Betaproteobacteria bacterium]